MWRDQNTMGIPGWTMMIASWGAIDALVVVHLRSLGPMRPGATNIGDGAPNILERRFAAGEIDRGELEERLLDGRRETLR